MATERYEGTEPFYVLSDIENGNYQTNGTKDSELMLFIRTAAHFIRQSYELQAEFCTHCREQLAGKDWRSMVPLKEIALAEMFESFLTKKGIEDIPDVEFDDAPISDEVEVVDEKSNIEVNEEPEKVQEVEAEEVQEVDEVTNEPIEVTIKPMAVEREIVPTLELETTDGTLIIAGESYFHKLYDEEQGCFRSDAAEEKFNEIDAFIADELIHAEELDYEAISEAVCAFMEEVEQAS